MGNVNDIKLIKWANGLLSKGGGTVTNDKDCCCCYCCYKYDGDEYLTNGANAQYFARLGDVHVKLKPGSQSTFVNQGKCSVRFEFPIVVEEQLNLDSCETTGSLTLTYDCTVCDKAYWYFEMIDCAGDNLLLQTPLWWIGGPDCAGASADDPVCGDLNGFEEAGIDIIDPNNSVRIATIGECVGPTFRCLSDTGELI